ncbi:MAG: helix-turn-helix transcriptional regulator [Bacteroidia bacterium]
MPKKNFPVYNIEQFNHVEKENDFYANTFPSHLKEHHFINTPHKHDFYLVVLFTKGKGKHEIDFLSYDIKPGSIFLLSPGQTHNWQLSKDIDGYVFFHTKDFYDLNFTTKKLKDYPFFSSIHNSPVLYLKTKTQEKTVLIFKEILQEYQEKKLMSVQKISSLVDVLYIDLSREYLPQKQQENQNSNYISKLRKLESLIDLNYKTTKLPREYASLMNMSEKHLNRICKTCLNKTTTDLISDRIILEAKRMLVQANYTVAEVANELGYFDNAYFSRLFKKKYGKSAMEFMKKYANKPI